MKIIKQQKIGAKKARLTGLLIIIAAGNDPKKKKTICFSNTKPLATLPNSRVGTIITDNFVTLIYSYKF